MKTAPRLRPIFEGDAADDGRPLTEAIEMRKALAVLGVAGLVLGAGARAGAEPPGADDHGGPRKGRVEGLARALGLSEEQKAEVRTLMEGQRAGHQALFEKLAKNREQLEQALQGANPDPSVVGELAIEGHRLHEQARALREAQEKAVRALLTPEQQAKFDAVKALREEGGPWGAGRPMGRRGPWRSGDDAPRP